mmetsp:Transcript_123715/g.309217  ORF Transcript_123715/g.309217 Transcript_123715/m.309217 type:complete len:659 (-) Transcript_123715:458-2434(-)
MLAHRCGAPEPRSCTASDRPRCEELGSDEGLLRTEVNGAARAERLGVRVVDAGPVDQGHVHVLEDMLTSRIHGPLDLPGKRLSGIVPPEVRRAELPCKVGRTLPIIFDEVERTVRACVDLNLQGSSRQSLRVLQHGRQREHGAGPHKGRDLVARGAAAPVTGALDDHRGLGVRSSGERVPSALREVELPHGVLPQDRGHEDGAVHPLSGDVGSLRVVRELHHQRPDPRGHGRVQGVRHRVVVGHEAVAQIERLLYVLRCLSTEVPRKVWDGTVDGVHAHDGHEGSDLHPARQLGSIRVAKEAPNVTAYIGCAAEHPIQHHAWCALEVIPCGVDVASPHGRPQAGHARRPRAIEREKALVGFLAAQGIHLSDVPPVEGVVVGLALVVPPEGHTVVNEVLNVLAVPLADFGLRVVQVALLRVAAWKVGRVAATGLTVREDPPLLPCHVKEVGVTQTGLPDPGHLDVLLVLVSGKLLLGLWEGHGIEAEVPVIRGARRLVAVVGLVREPLKINDDVVDREVPLTEFVNGVLDVSAVCPAPPRCAEAVRITRKHCRGTNQRVVGNRALFQGCRGNQVDFKWTLECPSHLCAVGAVLGRQVLHFRFLGHTESTITIRGVVVRRVCGPVAHQRIHDLTIVCGQLAGVRRSCTLAVELAAIRRED